MPAPTAGCSRALRWEGPDLYLDVRVQPRAAREGIASEGASGRVRVRVNAAPVDNAANRRLIELLAKELGVAKSQITVVAGHASRDKRLRISAPLRRPTWLQAIEGERR